jgi:hypothetical protein
MKPYLTKEQRQEIDRYYPDLEERKKIIAAAQKAGIKGLENPNLLISLARASLAFNFICENEQQTLGENNG